MATTTSTKAESSRKTYALDYLEKRLRERVESVEEMYRNAATRQFREELLAQRRTYWDALDLLKDARELEDWNLDFDRQLGR